jgi:hypothetical protein
MTPKKTYTRPPNKAAVKAKLGAKPKTGQPFPPPGQGGGPGGGGGNRPGQEMSVVITIGEVEISISGPIVPVMAFLQKWFGTTEPQSIISSLMHVWGKEVSMVTRKR